MITAPASLEAAELPSLRPRENIFVQGIADGLDQATAWRQAYPHRQDCDSSVRAAACRLRQRPQVAAWIGRIKAMAAERGAWSIGDQVERLDQLGAVAIASGNIGAAVAAEGLKIKLLWGSERRQPVGAMPAIDMLAAGKALMGDIWESSELYIKLMRRVPGGELSNRPVTTDDGVVGHKPSPVARLTLSPGETVNGTGDPDT